MTRIVAGTAGGRRLKVPPGETTRPTSDRVREALFSALDAAGALEGARVLDLYAGSGALGLEAASRGAAQVVLVEAARPAAATARANVAAVGLAGVRVVADTVERFLASAGAVVEGGWDLVLLDPPYAVGSDDVSAVLDAVVPLLAPGATVVVERSARSPEPRWPEPLTGVRERRYGETSVWVAGL
ncbi:16S rRNA (guanine(966)-N(2))-methyltransferase RsmD [Kineococcus aurantiacus]|uniref:16S rRNA (Guanine966-N2)-methyltransferase n=1 Tax=Kineococcus aurantiacus TaxID=37633 RepID=A0A7Y9DJK2_9ACTN|nr:16S rRNA (guanine966-N2)-methyltransferase [Kineococcus aurantiacus]